MALAIWPGEKPALAWEPGAERCAGIAMTIEEHLEKIEQMLTVLVQRQQVREWYTIDEFARLVGKAEFTVRAWCRLGRIHAKKKQSGRGAHAAWVISHEELERFRREGLLPIQRR